MEINMIDKLFEIIKLDRPLVFWSIVFAAFIGSVYVNNNYYYKSIDFIESNRLKNLISVIDESTSVCMELTNQDGKSCLHRVTDLLKNTRIYYGAKVTIKGKYGVLESDNREYQDHERVPTYYLSKLNALDSDIKVSTNAVPEIWSSVRRSITFSIEDIVKEDDWSGVSSLIKYKAWPRSAPAISYAFILLFTVWLLRQSIIAKIKLVRKFREMKDED